jgi:hypothetical protein
MKKILWAGGIGLGVIIVVILGLSIVVKGYLKSDRLKALIIPRVEEFTGRKAGIDRIDVSLFRGIVVKGISLMEQNGQEEFMKVKEFVLEYRLLPLLKKRLVIKRIDLVSPSVRLVREKDGRFNFTGIIEKNKGGKKETAPGAAGEKGLPVSVETDKISVRDARMTFTDAEGVLPAVSLVSDIDLKLSAERGLPGPEVSGKVAVRELTMKAGGSEIKSTGTVEIRKDAVDFTFTSTIGKDTIKLSGDVKDYMKKPAARVDLNAAELDLESLMALSEGKKETPKPLAAKRETAPQKEKGKGKEEKTAGLTASGEVKVGNAKYKGYVLKDFAARYNYSEGNVTISPISATLSGGKEATVQGTAKGDLRASVAARESAADSVKKTLAGKLTADLSRCEVKQSKIGEAIATFTGIRELASPKFDSVHFLFTVGNEKIALNGTMTSGLISLNPSGAVGFDKNMDVVADLKVAPGLGGGIVSGQFGRYIKDEKGWTVIPLRITGTTDKPSVGLNQAAVGKQIEKGATQEIQKRLFKGILGK